MRDKYSEHQVIAKLLQLFGLVIFIAAAILATPSDQLIDNNQPIILKS